MLIDPIALLFFVITIAVLAVVIFFLARGYTRTSEKLHEIEKTNTDIQNQLSQQPAKLLEQAHEKAQEIISIANKQATEIIASSKVYENNSNQALKDKLAALEQQQESVFVKASEDMKVAYQNMMTQIQEKDINTLKNMTKEVETDVLADFKEFRDVMEKETINSEKIAKEKIDEEYLAMEKDLQEYKIQKYQKVDEDIYKILYRVSEMVLNQGISYDKHKELVIEALETAKKEQVFQ
jgi:F0F1-type ATP synthase membrane subunit b/b'